MKQSYKLIKVYPNSPELDSVILNYNPSATSTTYDAWYSENYGTAGKLSFVLPKCLSPELYPEYWEEVKEVKEFPKIISFKRIKDKNLSYINEVFNRQDSGIFIGIDKVACTERDLLHGGKCVDSGDFEIYQVQVEDGTIFTIGDKVTWDYLKLNLPPYFTIKGFEINKNTNRIEICYDELYNVTYSFYSTLEKYKEIPWFTTTDGMNIYDGDKYWLLDDTNHFAILQYTGSKYWKNTNGDCKTFSTKQLAEDNRPKFSKVEIEEALDSCITKNCMEMSILHYGLFKQKLGI